VTGKHVILIFEKISWVRNFEKLLKGDRLMILKFIIFGIGIFIGCILMLVISRVKSVGSLRIDDSDPEYGQYLFLELSRQVDVVCRKKYITLRINNKSFYETN
jgi:hypothetical protein